MNKLRRRSMIVLLSIVLCGSVAAMAWRGGVVAGHRATVSCPPMPDRPLRYPDVEPVFAKHCNSCHNKDRSDNEAAMRVFESASYPFATERPNSLLADLEHMFETRGGLSSSEKCAGLHWLRAGALDSDGKPPAWRK